MAMPPMTDAVKAECVRLRGKGMKIGDIVKATGYCERAVRSTLKLAEAGVEKVPMVETDTRTETAEDAVIVKRSKTRIKTLKEAIAFCEVDEKEWYVDRHKLGIWEVVMKFGKQGNEHAHDEQLYKVELFLKRHTKRCVAEAQEATYERIKQHAPKYPPLNEQPGKGETYMGIFGLFDAHFGKLAWAAETGKSYDLKIADTIFRNAITDLIRESSNRKLTYAVLPLGNDFFHIDNVKNTTTAGTVVDTDGRYAKIIETGEKAFVWAVEQLAGICQVYIPVIPGNHDGHTSLHLARTLNAWFHRCKHVTVDLEPGPRKYIAWGCNLIGMAHGHQIAPEKLPNVMAQERPAEWAGATCREWLLGHMHRSRKWVTKPVDTHEGTTVRTLAALCTTDFWHHANGFIGTRSAAEVYWYGKERGYAGHAICDARV